MLPCRTVVAQDLLQLYSSVKLCSPTISLSAFVSALSDAACHSNLQQVRPHSCFFVAAYLNCLEHAACIDNQLSALATVQQR